MGIVARELFGLTFCSAPSDPPRVPKFSWLPCPWGAEGGRPPLTIGCGIGEGERPEAELAMGVAKFGFCGLCGTLCATAGEPLAAFIEPKWRFGLDAWALFAPFGKYPEVPCALIVTGFDS
jgi:hypothetical protein